MTRGLLNFLPALKAYPLVRTRSRGRKRTAMNMSTCGLQRVADVARDVSPLSPSSRLLPWRRRNGSMELSESHLSMLVSAVSTFDVEELSLQQSVFNPDLLDDDPHGILTDHTSYRLWRMADQRAIAYIPIVESPAFTIVVFVLPPGSTIPLHDHVDMTVVSRVLWGSLEVRSFDLIPNSLNPNGVSGVIAEKQPDDLVAAGETRWLTPQSGNIHSFTAKEWTAVFDVLVPPYDEDAGRSCNYYQERNDLSKDGKIVLEVCSKSFLHFITFLSWISPPSCSKLWTDFFLCSTPTHT